MAWRDWRELAIVSVLLAPMLAAQDRPQLVWEGQVDGVSVLRVRGNRVTTDATEGLPVERQRFHFYGRLPESRQNARLEVAEGRGFVHISEQPRADNEYTLTVSIEDRQPGSSFYSLAFYWDAGSGAGDPPAERARGRRESLTWSGRADGETIVSCRGSSCEAGRSLGGPATGDRFRFSKPLPASEVTVSLEKTEGRGDIRLLEQPRESNGYTARVLIRDPQGGSGDYRFSLVWSQPSRKEAGFESARLGIMWSGRVDGQVRVTVRGRATTSEAIGGARLSDERAQFARTLPAATIPNAAVRKLRGRGEVAMVEVPSEANHWQLVFEINGSQNGADDYEVEVRW